MTTKIIRSTLFKRIFIAFGQFTGAVLILISFSSPVTAAPLLYDKNITPDIIFGSGNSNGFFTVDRNNGVELGLRAKIPFTGTIHSNGDGSYSYSLSEANPRWNFDWTVNTDYDESSNRVISDLTYQIGIDFDPGIGTDFFTFDPVTLTGPLPFDHSIGNNLTPNGGGTEATDAVSYQNLIDNNNVLQQSWRHAFFTTASGKSYDPTLDGTYDIYLRAFDSRGLIASTQIRTIIGTGNSTSIPEPAPLILVVLGLLGIIGLQKRHRQSIQR